MSDIIRQLGVQVSLKDLGDLHYFIRVEVQQTREGIFLSQQKYIRDLLKRANMEGARPIHTPLSTKPTLQLNDGHPPADQKQYKSVIGALQYLPITRPDIVFAVNKLAQFMHQSSQLHWTSTKRVFRYLKGTITHGISLTPSVNPYLSGYSDEDWGTNPDNIHSTSAYLIVFRNCPISWSIRKQHLVARSCTEAKYRALASATSERIWIRTLLHALGIKTSKRPSIYCDNIGAT